MLNKKIVFLTGTRADFGKIKSLILKVQKEDYFDSYLFVTGMHLQEKYGYTVNEIVNSQINNIHEFINQDFEQKMDITLASTIKGFSEYISKIDPDLIVVHGDRLEALAGALVGSFNNYRVAHIEGGEFSGTIDESIRHSISKLSHIHFVSNKNAKNTLVQMGEQINSIFEIGSPDYDLMTSDELPSLKEAKDYYSINFSSYSIAMFHPVTTEYDLIENYAEDFFNALEQSNLNYIIIYPNNDLGSEYIINKINNLRGNIKFKIFPSLRFEYFLVFLKHSKFIIGNSSSGIREAPWFKIPTINIGTRQDNRFFHNSIINVNYSKKEILSKINQLNEIDFFKFDDTEFNEFGKGNSSELFLKILKTDDFWKTPIQKKFLKSD